MVCAWVTVAGAPAPAGADPSGGVDDVQPVDYSPPVDAPVTDPFRPPPRPWLPGNRGIEYQTAPGTAVRAAADGVVTFSGPVAGSLHVTIGHRDGIRTSYSFLSEVQVGAGQRVGRGQVIGVSGSRLHVGARRGDTYIDPESLWGDTGPPWVRLAPTEGGGSTSVEAPGPSSSSGGGPPGGHHIGDEVASAARPQRWLARPRSPWWEPDP